MLSNGIFIHYAFHEPFPCSPVEFQPHFFGTNPKFLRAFSFSLFICCNLMREALKCLELVEFASDEAENNKRRFWGDMTWLEIVSIFVGKRVEIDTKFNKIQVKLESKL